MFEELEEKQRLRYETWASMDFEDSKDEEDEEKLSTSILLIKKRIGDCIPNKNLISNTIKDRPSMLKERLPAKSSLSSSSIKKVRCRSNPVNGSKLQVVENKPKKMSEGAANNCPSGAEDKLNELLDIDGGISKRKDATFYLKLLIVTASSGDNGEALQSTRNLSIILDALLKTKKRNVLNDVISKNGLQMLHNILKQNRTNHKRIPIIRKLLKILEYLAQKEVLTLELINSAPPCSGVESFRESIMKLAWHKDIQVHTIARRFRDTWIPHPSRRNNYSDRDATNVEQQPDLSCNRFSTHRRWCGNNSRHITDNASMNHTSNGANSLYANMQDSVGPSVDNYPANIIQMRKRKSRWDQPEEGNSGAQTIELMEDHKAKRTLAPRLQESSMREAVEEPVDDVNEEIVFLGCDQNISEQCESASKIDEMRQIHDDAPPGFPSLPLVSHDTATENPSSDIYHRNCSCELVTGCLQERYLSHIHVSYGIPLFFVDQLGTPQAESVDRWKISTGIPFHPFPPLPSYPRDKSKTLPPSCTSTRMEHGESQRDHQGDVSSTPCISRAMSSEVANTRVFNQQMAQRMRSSPGNLGRRYFRQQKWTNSKPPPWVRNRNCRGFMENNLRSGTLGVGVGNSEKESGNVCYSEGAGGLRLETTSKLEQNGCMVRYLRAEAVKSAWFPLAKANNSYRETRKIQESTNKKPSFMVMEEDLVEKDGKNTRPEKPINMKKRVLITFYVESKARRLLSKNVDSGQEIVRKNVMGSPSLLRHGYDRKAQLLAYARKLRSSTNYQSHNPKLPNKNFPSKTK
ncbi:Histone-lysine n-methyltransferase ashh2, partial [Thalictrum thalictroides]